MKLLILASLLLLVVLLMSCGESNPTGSTLSGDIWGHVELYDSDGVVQSDHSGVSVTLEGTNFVATSDAPGIWRLKNVPAGVYTAVFRKEGYSWTKEQVQYVGNGEYYFGERVVVGIPTFAIPEFSAEIAEHKRVDLTGRISQGYGSGVWRHVTVFLSNDSTKFEKTNSRVVANLVGGYVDEFVKTSIDARDLYQLGFPAGSLIYLRAYPSNPLHTVSHDLLANEYYNTNCSDAGSPIVAFVVP